MTRFLTGSGLVFFMFIIAVILSRVETMGGALQQGSLFGIASLLPARNIKAILEGQAIAGVIGAIGRITTLATSPEVTFSAFIFFLIALLYLAISMILTWMLKRNDYFMYYYNNKAGTALKDDDRIAPEDMRSLESLNNYSSGQSLKDRLFQTLKEVWLHGLCAMFALMVTLCVYPALFVRLRPMNYDVAVSDPWTKTYYLPVIVFLSFNTCDWLGRLIAGFIKWPRRDQKWILLIISVIRIGTIPIVLFMNIYPRKNLPIVFYHDAFPIIYIILMGLGNGYLLTLAMMYGPTYASPANLETAGVALTIYMACGLSIGVAVSYGLALLI